MTRAASLVLDGVLASILLAGGLTAQTPVRARDILPAEGLVASSVTVIQDQAALNAHYFLADEAALGLGPRTDAVFARYRAGAGEALLLVAVHPSAEAAGRVYGRFGRDFFSERFDPTAARFFERIETGDWVGAARQGPVLIVVLEAPDRAACESLLDRAAGQAPAAKSP
ncbi:MAG TPA: hypothetical protein ENO03_07940 [Candidatus Aminicenantes bacterium]|nr:hypothetical protein [Candidatus Aminicenantes bacterium]HDT14269.1 hypothetical protein [Candidatus Aminicenantes bacterium]